MNFEFDNPDYMACQAEFNLLDPNDSLYMTHYDLAKATGINDAPLWKQFLTDTRVSNWIDQEITLIKQATLRRMIKNADSNDRSVGAAQMLNALNKSFETDTTKEGPMFVYMAVPLNEREQGAPNAYMVDEDIFDEEE